MNDVFERANAAMPVYCAAPSFRRERINGSRYGVLFGTGRIVLFVRDIFHNVSRLAV